MYRGAPGGCRPARGVADERTVRTAGADARGVDGSPAVWRLERRQGDRRAGDQRLDRCQRLRAWLFERKREQGCAECGANDGSSLDVHHREAADKEMDVSTMVTYGYGTERLREELRRCVRTATERNSTSPRTGSTNRTREGETPGGRGRPGPVPGASTGVETGRRERARGRPLPHSATPISDNHERGSVHCAASGAHVSVPWGSWPILKPSGGFDPGSNPGGTTPSPRVRGTSSSTWYRPRQDVCWTDTS